MFARREPAWTSSRDECAENTRMQGPASHLYNAFPHTHSAVVTGAGGDLLQLIQLRSAAEKRAEEAEANLKQEQQSVWKLKQEVKMLEMRLTEAGRTRCVCVCVCDCVCVCVCVCMCVCVCVR